MAFKAIKRYGTIKEMIKKKLKRPDFYRYICYIQYKSIYLSFNIEMDD